MAHSLFLSSRVKPHVSSRDRPTWCAPARSHFPTANTAVHQPVWAYCGPERIAMAQAIELTKEGGLGKGSAKPLFDSSPP
jgi:hypothetical protein